MRQIISAVKLCLLQVENPFSLVSEIVMQGWGSEIDHSSQYVLGFFTGNRLESLPLSTTPRGVQKTWAMAAWATAGQYAKGLCHFTCFINST